MTSTQDDKKIYKTEYLVSTNIELHHIASRDNLFNKKRQPIVRFNVTAVIVHFKAITFTWMC